MCKYSDLILKENLKLIICFSPMRFYQLVRCQKLCDPMKEWIQSCLDLVKSGLIITEPTAVPSDGRFGLSIETVTSDAPIEAVQTEARSLSAYNRSIKMVDNMQYRLVFTSSSLIDETSFLTQAFQFLARVDSHHFGRQLAQSIVEARPPLPFGWAWWIDEAKLCGRGGDMVDVGERTRKNTACVP